MSEYYDMGSVASFERLPENVDAQINAIWEQFYERWDDGKLDEAEQLGLKAWDALPEPKLSWDYYANVIPRVLTEFYRDRGQFDEAAEWLTKARVSYGPGRNVTIEFLAATIDFAKGDLDAAFEEFNRQFERFGKRAFQDEDTKYLELVLSRRAQ